MIDTIKVCLHTCEDNLKKEKWTICVNGETGEYYYCTYISSVWIRFYPNTANLIIGGKYASIVTHNKVDNFDDIYSDKEHLLEFFNIFQKKLNKLFHSEIDNILDCKVTRIDYCFNIYSENVDNYLEFFNCYYINYRNTKFKRYVNYTDKAGFDKNSSVYLKTSCQFVKNKNQKYTINMYNKAHQLITKQSTDVEKKRNSNIKQKDIDAAKNILRLEVQLHHEKLKSVCNKYGISWSARTLRDFCDINIAKEVVSHEIKRFFTDCDFYSYKAVKNILKKEKKDTQGMLDFIYKVSKHNKVDLSSNYIRTLKKLGIFPYMFLSPKLNMDKLENPIKLIDKKILDNNSQNLGFAG